MMAVYVCDEHQMAFPAYNRFTFHWLAAHKGDEDQRPSKEAAERDEVPVGYSLREGKGGPRGTRATSVSSAPSLEILDIEELPTDPVELFRTILLMKGIQESKATQLSREFKLSPWMWSDAQEIQGLLKGSRIGLTDEGIRSFLKQYGNTVELPPQGGGVAFVQGRPAREEFFGQFQPQVREDPQTLLMKYMMAREERAETRRPDPATEERMRSIEASNQQVMETQNQLLELLKKQEEDSKQAMMEARFQRLEEMIASGGKQSEGDEGWLRAFLDEREKRHTETMQEMINRLGTANELVAKAQEEAKTARSEAISEEETRRTRYKREFEDAGYHPREKTTEERVMDIAEEKVIPAIVSEGANLRRIVERAVGGSGPTGPRAAVSGEEAAKLAEAMEIEESLRQNR